MVLRNTQPETPDVRRLTQQVARLYQRLDEQGGIVSQINNANASIQSLLNTRAAQPAAPVANLLWNGEEGHSVHTWFDIVDPPAIADTNKECAFFYSHNAPAVDLTFTDADVNTTDNTIRLEGHTFTTGSTVDLLKSGGSLPTPLAISTTYFVIVVDAVYIQLATTIADAFSGSEIDITTTGSAGETFTIQELLIQKDARTGSTNNTLKNYSHSTYDGRYSRWNSSFGWGEFNGTRSIDILMPANLIDATTPLARVSCIVAKSSSYIEIPEEALMGVGIWDNTSGQRHFLQGDIGLTATLTGTPGIVERRFKVLLSSDRGYQILSSEVIISNGPADGDFTATDYISLSWRPQSGQLYVDIYEYLPNGGDGMSAAEYRYIGQVSSANSLIYLGTYQATAGGYPVPTGTIRSATFFTRTGEMADIATNEVSGTWSTVNFPNAVPNNYDKGVTTDRQWVRAWLTVAPNIYIPTGVNTDGSAIIELPDNIINSAALTSGGYGTGTTSLYVGLEVQIYDDAGVLVDTSTIAEVNSNTEIELADSIAAGSNRQMRIVGGGFHGVYMDKIHLGYQQNTSYAPNAQDVRTLQPLAAPSSSSQGTVGTGGTGGGIHNCLAHGQLVRMHAGHWVEVQRSRPGKQWASGELKPNLLVHLKHGVALVRRVRSTNGVEVICTDSEAFVVETLDTRPKYLYQLRPGDPVVTEVDGKIEICKIESISSYLGSLEVFSPVLDGGHLFIAGQLRLSLWQRFKNWVFRRRVSQAGFLLHNSKPVDDPQF